MPATIKEKIITDNVLTFAKIVACEKRSRKTVQTQTRFLKQQSERTEREKFEILEHLPPLGVI